MELRLGARTFGSREFAIMTDGLVEGADIAEIPPDETLIRTVRADRPALVIAVAPGSPDQAGACVRAGADLLIGDAFAGVAAATGTGIVCSAPTRAVRPTGVLVRAEDPGNVEALAAAGHAVLADEPVLALLAVYAWLGARVFRTSDVAGTRDVLDMVASDKGFRPPAVARRGLA